MTANRTVLAIGGNRFPWHRFEERGPQIEAALGDAADVTLTTDRDDLVDLSAYDVVLDYISDSTLSESQRDGLLSFVDDGGGYVGVHCAADLNSIAPDDPDEVIEQRAEPFPELRELIGGHFLTHPEETTFEVRVVDSYHPITATLDDYEVWDEPYVVEVDDDVRVLARMDHPEYPDVPVSWVKEYGDGRVFFVSSGHGEPALTNESVGELLREGTRWAAGDTP